MSIMLKNFPFANLIITNIVESICFFSVCILSSYTLMNNHFNVSSLGVCTSGEVYSLSHFHPNVSTVQILRVH